MAYLAVLTPSEMMSSDAIAVVSYIHLKINTVYECYASTCVLDIRHTYFW